MQLKISLKIRNSEFSKEISNQYHDGKESVDNQKFKSSKLFKYRDEIDDIKEDKNKTLDLEKILFKNMRVLKFIKDGDLYSQIAVSEDLLERSPIKNYKEKYNTTYITFYMKDRNDVINFSNQYFVLKHDLIEKD